MRSCHLKSMDHCSQWLLGVAARNYQAAHPWVNLTMSLQSQQRKAPDMHFVGSRGIHQFSWLRQKESRSTSFPSLRRVPLKPKPLFHLPVIATMVDRALSETKNPPLERTAVICIYHPLQTYVNFFEAIIRLGAKPSNIFVLGKRYSECQSVIKQIKDLGVYCQPCSAQVGLGMFSQSFTQDVNWLWFNVLASIKKDVKEVLILDHGGHALSFIPEQILRQYKVVGVEKTTRGLINLKAQGFPPLPLIGVAHCAAKRILESPLIAEAVIAKLLPLISIKDKNLVCGIVGYGAIGKAITAKLLSMQHKVIVYDNDPNQFRIAKDIRGMTVTNELSALVASADYIFGCTGRDITTSIDSFRLSSKNKTLISCSSEDIEFSSLIWLAAQQQRNGKAAINPLADVEYHTDMGGTIRILKGGFPANFDGSGESVPANDIQLTRALGLGGVLQAARFFQRPDIVNSSGVYALDANMQKLIVNEWLKYQPSHRFPKDVIDQFQDVQWIEAHSGGTPESGAVFLQPTPYRAVFV